MRIKAFHLVEEGGTRWLQVSFDKPTSLHLLIKIQSLAILSTDLPPLPNLLARLLILANFLQIGERNRMILDDESEDASSEDAVGKMIYVNA